MNNKDLGILGEQLAIVELLKFGVTVSKPIGDNARYDLVIDLNGKLLKCQVKSNNQPNKDYVEFLLSSKHCITGEKAIYYGEVDLFLLVDITNNILFLFPPEADKKSVRFRYVETNAYNTKQVKYACDYELTLEKLNSLT